MGVVLDAIEPAADRRRGDAGELELLQLGDAVVAVEDADGVEELRANLAGRVRRRDRGELAVEVEVEQRGDAARERLVVLGGGARRRAAGGGGRDGGGRGGDHQ